MENQIRKYFQGELNKKEQLELLKQVESDKQWQEKFVEYKNLYALIHISGEFTDRQEAGQAYTRFLSIKRSAQFKKVFLRTIGYAAAMAAIVVTTHFFTSHSIYRKSQKEVMTSLYVPAGQRVQITLQDGTDVWLHSQTQLTYPTTFSGKDRRVTIEGEGYFKVAKNASKPFIVSSQGVEMKVLGTEFNVYSYPSEGIVQTSLLSGSLHVYYPEFEDQGVIMRPNDQVTVVGNAINKQSGQAGSGSIPANTGGSSPEMPRIEKQKIPHPDYFLWKDGIYSFENELLINIIKKLELYYDVRIVVKDPTIYEWAYRGKFRQRDGIDEILKMIQRIHKFTIEKDEENSIITLNK